jgi:2-oxoglutarate ferredoxin oxidoreductase subunit beta
MSETTNSDVGAAVSAATIASPATDPPREKLTKKAITADHPTWCPGCGDFAVLASFYKVLEKRQLDHEKIVTLAGIGCSSRFPYFVNGHGAHFIHGRAVPLATGISLARPDLHVFLFGGDGDGFSIGGNHLDHGARKNINLTYFIMDNFVYGLTKKQTSPTSPIGFKSKTDPQGRDRSAGQRHEKIDRIRRHLCRPDPCHAGQSHDTDDRTRNGSSRFFCHRMFE